MNVLRVSVPRKLRNTSYLQIQEDEEELLLLEAMVSERLLTHTHRVTVTTKEMNEWKKS
jgi:hypothetical protein